MLLSSLLDSPNILANDPEADEILSVVGGLEGFVLARRHSWISPRFNSDLLAPPLSWDRGDGRSCVECPKRFWGARTHTHQSVGAPQVPSSQGRSFLPLLALCVNLHQGPANAFANSD